MNTKLNSSRTELQNIIESYLWFRYLPPEKFPEWLDECLKTDTEGKVYDIKETDIRIDQLFDKLLLDNEPKNHIVPLSGGWDSRFILAALREHLEPKQITTVSFGSKGQLDYEIGKKVAKTAGVIHHQVDLKELDFSWGNIVKSARRAPWTHVPDEMFNHLSVASVAGEGDVIWSGFMGDPITGSHLVDGYPKSFKTLKKNFAYKAKRGGDYQLTRSSFKPEEAIPEIPGKSKLYIDDALDFGVRQANCIAPIVLPVKQWEKWDAKVGKTSYGADVIAPFVDELWAGYWLSAPREVRKDQILYHDVLNKKYPKLFDIPTKEDFKISDLVLWNKFQRKIYGLKKKIQKEYPWMRIRATKKLNYVDFDELVRTDHRYEETMVYALNLLKEKYPIDWLDLNKIWDEHYSRKKEHGLILQMLLGLAANLEENFSKE